MSGILYLNAVVARMADVIKYIGALEQGFGRNAAPIQTDPAQTFPFDHGSLQAELSRANGRDISSGAAAQYDDIKIHE